jgi:hypothetical protein
MMRTAIIAVAVLTLALPAGASAQSRLLRPPFGGIEAPLDPGARPGPGGGGLRPGGQTISMQQAVAIVSRRTPGRLLDASPAGANYRIVWITPDGRRIDFIVDASSGAILSGG